MLFFNKCVKLDIKYETKSFYMKQEWQVNKFLKPYVKVTRFSMVYFKLVLL